MTQPLHPLQESKANLTSRLLFNWVYPLIRFGRHHTIQSSNLPPLQSPDQATTLAPLFHSTYRATASADHNIPSDHIHPSLLSSIAPKIPSRYLSRTFRALLPVSGSLFIFAAAWKPLWLATAISQVYAVRTLVQHVTDQADSLSTSSQWAFLPVVFSLPITAMILSISSHAIFYASMRAGMRVRAALSAELYRKTLRLSAAALANVSEGQMGNLLVNDTQRIMDSYSYFHFCWTGFVELFVISMLLFIDLGPAALFGLAFLFLLVPAQIFFSALVSSARVRVSTEADVRVQKMNELLSGIRIIKQSAWEHHFQSVVDNLRAQEVKHLRLGAVLRAVNAALFFAAPVLVSLCTFAAHTIIFRKTLTPAVAFGSLAYFSIISRSLTFIPLGWLAASEASVSSARLDRFFDLEEISTLPAETRLDVANIDDHPDLPQPCPQTDSPPLPNCTVSLPDPVALPRVLVQHAQFSFAQQQTTANELATVLNDISISVSDRQLLTIVGPVGSGKSSLLLGILGEILCTTGSAHTNGTIAYCAQKPWIVNGSVRDNIIMFGPAFDPKWYKTVVDACCLARDLRMLPAGDSTEIGERGVNLSGGQKARISLARAVYSKADIYLLDDPLSAVDSAVSAELIRCVFGPNGLLANRAQIMVTHHLNVLPVATKVAVLGSGTVEFSGSYEELRSRGVEFSGFAGAEDDLDHERSLAAMDNEDQEDRSAQQETKRFMKLLQDAKVDVTRVGCMDDATGEDGAVQKKIAALNDLDEDMDSIESSSALNGDLIVDEDRRVGRVTSNVYKAYCKAAGGLPAIILLFLVFATAQGVRQIAEWWLAQWSTYRYSDSADLSDADMLFAENRFYALVFLGLAVGTALLTMLRAGIFAEWTLAASKRMHNDLLERVLHATPLFFDTNPVGRILNRFSKDIDQMDVLLPVTFQDFLQISFAALGALVTISVILPWFLIPVIPLVFAFYLVQRVYKMTSRELKRIEGVTRSPVYSHFVETLDGLATVRAYRSEGNFSSYFNARIDCNHGAYHMFSAAGRWLGVRLDFISSMVVFFTSLVVLIISPNLNPGLAGVALTQSIQMTGVFQWGVRQAAETENLFTSVERVSSMATETPVEKAYKVPGKEPPSEWPKDGVIAFDNVVLKYRPELDAALLDLSFKSVKHERIGIVGRTGSGKSSLFVALFRMVELCDGSITIDGKDISEMGLHDLRSNMAIVPQDPVLFNGTIRSNLDPTGLFNDAQLWDALHRVHMSRAIQSINSGMDCDGYGLDLIVHEKGSNFSAGERQLLSLARAILSGVKVVVLDEASASLDNRTDMLIQKTVREQLSDRTVLTIAHRLATVADSDRILVMDAGEAVEFDTPTSLISNGGYFSRLVEETGPIESTILKAIIAEASSVSAKKQKV